ncbi:MAG: helicase HerA domain-containing protein [Candidatus Micrarchaeia archaeon]
MQLGTVIANAENPNTSEFAFVFDKNAKVKKGQYVQAESEDGLVFGYIADVYRGNRYFERAESVSEYEMESKIAEQFPVKDWEYIIGKVKILGSAEINNGSLKQKRTSIPPFPGAKVHSANEDFLRQFVGFTHNGLLLGKLQNHEVEARVDMTRLLQKHVAILAMSGAGKSHLASVLIEEILDRKKEDGRIAVVVVDIHGEYYGFKEDPAYKSKTKVVNGKDIKISFRRLTPAIVREFFPNLSHPQYATLANILKEMRTEMKNEHKEFSIRDLIAKIEASKVATENVKLPLLRALHELGSYRIISTAENPKFAKDIKPGKLLILDLSDLDDYKKKQILVSYAAKRLFKLRKDGRIPPVMFLVEEAHNFAPERIDKYSGIAKRDIEKIAREGRKFGISLCLISQRPVNLSTTALSQCNTHIILRVTNPNDLQHIGESSEGIDQRMLRNITALQTGEGIIVGSAVNAPIFIDIRERKSKKKERGKPLHEQALEFENRQQKNEEDVEAFL